LGITKVSRDWDWGGSGLFGIPISSRLRNNEHNRQPRDFTMAEVEEVSALIGEIYDAALDPALWPSAFENVCKFTGSSQVTLFSQDSVRNVASLHFSAGLEPEFRKLYEEKYCKINPIFPTMMFYDVEEAH